MNHGRYKALFLDCDGVINLAPHYVHCRETFQFQAGLFELRRAARNLGYLLVVVTNQCEIARADYTEQAVLQLTDWMIDRFAEQQIQIACVYYCPYRRVHGIGGYKRDSLDRKPKPVVLLRAQRDLDLTLPSSVLIGDQAFDMRAARAAGIGTKIALDPEVADIKVLEPDCYVATSLHDICNRFLSIIL